VGTCKQQQQQQQQQRSCIAMVAIVDAPRFHVAPPQGWVSILRMLHLQFCCYPGCYCFCPSQLTLNSLQAGERPQRPSVLQWQIPLVSTYSCRLLHFHEYTLQPAMQCAVHVVNTLPCAVTTDGPTDHTNQREHEISASIS
jgi:hypothetical protein